VYNTAVGFDAGQLITTGTANTLVGGQVGAALTNGTHNTFVGKEAGGAATTGDYNTFIGAGTIAGTGNFGAGSLVTTGSKNTIIGGYNGNQNSLDLRNADNNTVLSDGDGNIRLVIDSSGRSYFTQGATPSYGSHAGIISTTSAAGLQCFTAHNVATSGTRFFAYFLLSGGAGTNVGSITSTGSATAYNTSSDYRLKENVSYEWDATTRLKQLKPCRFNFIADADTTVDGFLAHEAQAVVPEAVHGTYNEVDDDGVAVMQGIDQSKLVPLLVKAIQEQQTLIESLTTRITALEG
jgi:hypothetical protein